MATFTYESIKYRFKNPTVDGNLDLLDDGAQIKIAADDDLILTHSGSVGDITCSTGALDINAGTLNIKDEASSETMASFVSDGAVTLNHDNAARLATSSAGVSITGTTTSSGTITSSANLVIADGGTIGSASDTDAITIAAGGAVTFSQTPVLSGASVTAGTLPLTSLDIDGGTDLGAALVDADLMIVDDGAGGTNRKAAMSRIKTYILESVYPVNSIFTSTSSTNPGTSLGFGTWAAFGEGRVLVGKASSGTFATGGATGGAETHTLSVSEIPSHTHTEGGTQEFGTTSSTSTGVRNTGNFSPGKQYETQATGGGSAHNILQPYIVVYMWKRTS